MEGQSEETFGPVLFGTGGHAACANYRRLDKGPEMLCEEAGLFHSTFMSSDRSAKRVEIAPTSTKVLHHWYSVISRLIQVCVQTLSPQ